MNLEKAFCDISLAHLLGCSPYGEDLGSLIVKGLGRSVLVATLVVFFKLSIALPFGTALAWAPKKLQNLGLRLLDAIMAFPSILLAILCATLLTPPGLSSVILSLTITGWAAPTRLIQGLICQNLNLPHVEAARALGANIFYLHWKTIYPALWGQIALYSAHAMASTSLAEAGLCFLGLGGEPGTISLGHLIAEGRQYLVEYPHLSIAPGMALFSLVFILNLTAEKLRKKYGIF